MDIHRLVLSAHRQIRTHIRETPLERSAAFSQRGEADVYFKLENLQHTGSFKVRGALNKILSMSVEARERGVVTASSGNHGAAVAFALGKTGSRGTVFVPENASPAKVANIERLGADIQFHGTDSADTEAFARAFAERHDRPYVPPYNDAEVVAGQGTVGVELVRQLEPIDAVFVSIGGGGLISGIAGFLSVAAPDALIYGVSPENSKVMIESVRAGEILDMDSLPTLSDGTAGGIEPGSITFEVVRDHVDELVSVSEEEIATAMRDFMGSEHMLVEGAAGTAIAGYLQRMDELRGRSVVVLVCGANIALDTLKSIL